MRLKWAYLLHSNEVAMVELFGAWNFVVLEIAFFPKRVLNTALKICPGRTRLMMAFI